MSRPRSTACTSVAKLSSVRTILAACLVTSEPLPIATPTSACLSAAASLTASPVIATTSPASCISRARRSLSSGATRPNTCSCGSCSITSASVEASELGAGDHARAQPELVGDRPGGDGVVAGDHADVDPGGERDADGVLGLGAQRVDDADQRDEDEVRARLPSGRRAPRPSRRRRGRGPRTPARAVPARTAAGWRRGCSSRTSAIGTGSPCHSAVVQRSSTTSGAPLTADEVGLVQDRRRRALGAVVERRHELVLGVERHLGPPREWPAASPRRRRRSSRRARPGPPRSGRR